MDCGDCAEAVLATINVAIHAQPAALMFSSSIYFVPTALQVMPSAIDRPWQLTNSQRSCDPNDEATLLKTVCEDVLIAVRCPFLASHPDLGLVTTAIKIIALRSTKHDIDLLIGIKRSNVRGPNDRYG